MSLKKISTDVKECIRKLGRLITGVPNIDERSAFFRRLLDDTDFWQKADKEPQLLDRNIGLYDGKKRIYSQYIFRNCAYIIKGNFTREQVSLLIQDDFDAERRKFERLRHKFILAQHTEPRNERTAIPEDVRIAVWRRDNGRCARCGSRERLEYDHMVPVSRGGSNTVRNIELLCESCNRSKGANIQ